MNRRKAIKYFLIIGGGAAGVFAGIKGYKILRYPDLTVLDKHSDLLSELSEVIIPQTESVGAKEAETGKFIIKMVKDCLPKASQNNFIDGIEDLVRYTKNHYSTSFSKCTTEQKNQVLSHFEKEGKPFAAMLGKIQHRIFGDSFFTTLKHFTVLGFCTSQAGATKALRYDYIPGKYVGITSLQSGDKAWATQ